MLETEAKAFYAACQEFEKFKDSLTHAQFITLKNGEKLRVWKFCETWHDHVDCVRVHDPKQPFFGGGRWVRIDYIQEVHPITPNPSQLPKDYSAQLTALASAMEARTNS